MPSEWDGLLEGLAREIVSRVTLPHLVGGGIVHVEPAHVREVDGLLRAKLLPLLEAGQAMRQTYPYYGGPKATWTCKEAWDAAREAALKGEPVT